VQILGFFAKRKGFNNSRIFNFNVINTWGRNISNWCIKISDNRDTQQYSQNNARNSWRGLLKDEKGTTIIEVLMVATLMIFLTYASIEYWVVMRHHQNASHVVNKYLATMSIQGMLTEEAKSNLESELNNVGLDLLNIKATEELRLRNIKNFEESKLYLQIAVVPRTKPLLMGNLIKTKTPSTSDPVVPEVAEEVDLNNPFNNDDKFKIVVGGEILSERVHPD
jgi:hypothetical protein